MARLPDGPDETPMSLWNPTTEDFVSCHANDDNIQIEYTVFSQQLTQFPSWLATKLAKRLAQKIALTRMGGSNYEDEYNKAFKQITEHE